MYPLHMAYQGCEGMMYLSDKNNSRPVLFYKINNKTVFCYWYKYTGYIIDQSLREHFI